jgi:3-dehydroquinate synthase
MTAITIPVGLEARGYDVVVGAGVLAEAGARLSPRAQGRKIAIVTDAHVAALHLPALHHALSAAGLNHATIVLPPGEETKRFAILESLCNDLLALELDRKDIIIALGGGVIGDIAGFAAGIVKRGLDYVQIPTTLLAQVDSSVGGKTAIDTPAGKNLIGLFHQPVLVLADLTVLQTLPERQMRAGYAEIVKYGLIDDAAFYDWCEANASRVLAHDAEALAYAVAHSVRAKARIVAADEREAGQRALLNLGHTFAHALESGAGMGDALLHGEAVGAGLALAFQFSARLGLCSPQDSARVGAHLKQVGFATALNAVAGGPFSTDRLLAAMRQDKKTEGGALTFILARGIGASFVAKNVAERDVLDFLKGA